MQPTDINLLLTIVTNSLYTTMAEKDFFNLAIFLSLLSKEMLAMEVIRDLVKIEKIEEKEEKAREEGKDPFPPPGPIPPPGPGPGPP